MRLRELNLKHVPEELSALRPMGQLLCVCETHDFESLTLRSCMASIPWMLVHGELQEREKERSGCRVAPWTALQRLCIFPVCVNVNSPSREKLGP